MKIKLLACVALCSALLGCSTVPAPEPVVFETVECVTPTLNARKSLLLIQNIHTNYYGTAENISAKNANFEAYLATNSRKVKLSILLMSHRAWDISYNGEMIFEERESIVPQELQAAHLLRDITLSYWPENAIEKQSRKLDIVDSKNTRKVIDPLTGETLVDIRYEGGASITNPIGRIVLNNHKEQYELVIDSRQP